MIFTVTIYCNTDALQTKTTPLQLHCFVANLVAILSCFAASLASFRKTVEVVCKIISIVLHLSFLSVFSWMHVIAWSLFTMTLSKTRFLADLLIQPPKWVKILLRYTFGLAVPMIIVLCSVGLDHLWSPGFMDYGKDGLCWINTDEGMLYLFLVSNVLQSESSGKD